MYRILYIFNASTAISLCYWVHELPSLFASTWAVIKMYIKQQHFYQRNTVKVCVSKYVIRINVNLTVLTWWCPTIFLALQSSLLVHKCRYISSRESGLIVENQNARLRGCIVGAFRFSTLIYLFSIPTICIISRSYNMDWNSCGPEQRHIHILYNGYNHFCYT